MKERPILFSGPMVRALLEGRKTQTRRVMKGISDPDLLEIDDEKQPVFLHHERCGSFCDYACGGEQLRCPYGVPGDRLWVKETWWRGFGNDRRVAYCADQATPPDWYWKKVSSIHMPRWASRITLEVVGIRVERVESITEADAIAEGFGQTRERAGNGINWQGARAAFLETFYDLNQRAPRGTNPWVWVVEFKRIGGGA